MSQPEERPPESQALRRELEHFRAMAEHADTGSAEEALWLSLAGEVKAYLAGPTDDEPGLF